MAAAKAAAAAAGVGCLAQQLEHNATSACNAKHATAPRLMITGALCASRSTWATNTPALSMHPKRMSPCATEAQHAACSPWAQQAWVCWDLLLAPAPPLHAPLEAPPSSASFSSSFPRLEGLPLRHEDNNNTSTACAHCGHACGCACTCLGTCAQPWSMQQPYVHTSFQDQPASYRHAGRLLSRVESGSYSGAALT